MKIRNSILFTTLAVFSVLVLMSCTGRPMGTAEYEEISEEFTEELVRVLLDPDAYDAEMDIEEIAYLTLQEVTARHGYNATIYLNKAEELDEDWDDIWERVEIRLEQEFQRIWNEMNEDEPGEIDYPME